MWVVGKLLCLMPVLSTVQNQVALSSYKGSTLEVGERSSLIIGPSGMEYAVTSSSAGECGIAALTVGTAADPAPSVEDNNLSVFTGTADAPQHTAVRF